MVETVESLSEAFNTKIDAARFFFEKLRSKEFDPRKRTSIQNEFYYFLDACIFELHAASQMMLQIINIQSGLNRAPYQVSWNPSFKKELEQNSRNLFLFWEQIDHSSEFSILEAMRQYIAHRGRSGVSVSVDAQGIISVISIGVRYRYVIDKVDGKRKPKQIITNGSIDIYDELPRVANYLLNKHVELVGTVIVTK